MWVFRFGGFRGCCIFSGKCHVSLSSNPAFDTYIGSNAGSDDNDIRRVHTLIPRMLSNAGLDDSDIHQMHTLKAYVEYGIHTPIANTGSYTCVLGTSGTWQSLPASRIFLFSFLSLNQKSLKLSAQSWLCQVDLSNDDIRTNDDVRTNHDMGWLRLVGSFKL